MTPEQEIRATALEIAFKTFSLLPEAKDGERLKEQRLSEPEAIINIATYFEDYIKGGD
jgi:hypothetical protein